MGIVLDFRSPGMAWIGNEVIPTGKVSFDSSKDTDNNIATKGNIIQGLKPGGWTTGGPTWKFPLLEQGEGGCSLPFWHRQSDCCGSRCTTRLSYPTQRMPHPLYGEWYLAMQFRRSFQPPWAVFLLSAPLMLLLCAKHMLCTPHIPHNVLWW